MDKFNLTKRVCNLQVGDIFYFSGGWRKVLDIKNGMIYYKGYTELYLTVHQQNETLMARSQMLVQLKQSDHE